MPIVCSIEMKRFDQDSFHTLDKKVMSHAFDLHNNVGRFCDEPIYQDELAQRCRNNAIGANREVPIRVSHCSFVKSYYLDLVIESGIIYELKAVNRLCKKHDTQLINYQSKEDSLDKSQPA
jgi:GxxExxY protein